MISVVQFVFVKVIRLRIQILYYNHGLDDVNPVHFLIQMVKYGLMGVDNVYVIKANNYVDLYHVQLQNVHNLYFYQIDVVRRVQVNFSPLFMKHELKGVLG